MSLLNLILPVFQQPDSTEDPKVNNALNAIQTWANGAVDFSNFAPSAGLLRAGTPHNLTIAAVVDNPTCGPTGTGQGGGIVRMVRRLHGLHECGADACGRHGELQLLDRAVR